VNLSVVFLENEYRSLFQKTKRKYLVPADVSNASVVTNRLELALPLPTPRHSRLTVAPPVAAVCGAIH